MLKLSTMTYLNAFVVFLQHQVLKEQHISQIILR